VVPATAAVAYLRRSTDRQEQSIPDQLRAVEAYCQREGLTLLRSYTDDAISGTSSLGRKAFQQLMTDAQSASRDFAFVVAYDVKRFGRVDNDEAGYYRHLLRSAGVEVRYASENFTGDGTDDLLRPVKQWQAREESKDLSKVTIRGLLTKSTTGAWMGGAPPYGFDLRYQSQSGLFLVTVRYNQDGTKAVLDDQGKFQRTLERGESIAVSRKDHCNLVPGDPARVQTVQEIYSMYLDGRGFKAIADQLNRTGVPSARCSAWAQHYSGQWSMTTVRAILVNPAYSGDMVWNRRTDARFYSISEGRAIERRGVMGRRLEPNGQEDWVVVKDAHPALVSGRRFAMVQERIEAQSKQTRGINPRTGQPAGTRERCGGGWTGPRARFVLSGLCTCARCGSRYEGYTVRGNKLDAQGERSQWRHYACGGYIRRGKSVCDLGLVEQQGLETAVASAILAFYGRLSGSRPALERAVGTALGVLGRVYQARSASLKARLTEIDALAAKLLDALSPATKEASERRVAALETERREIRSQLESLERQGLSEQEARATTEETARFLAGLGAALAGPEVAHRQAALRRCLAGAVVDAAGRSVLLQVFSVPISAEAGSCVTRAVTVRLAPRRSGRSPLPRERAI